MINTLERNRSLHFQVDFAAPRRSFFASRTSFLKYQALRENETRVIDLFPGTHVEQLRCRLRSVSLVEKPLYEALSYCWGVNRREVAIKCNDGSILITKSLFAALQRLRYGGRMRTLWIDAICINQEDMEERNLQVGLMKDIFQQSERTIVWLGEESQDSPHAMRLIAQLAKASAERSPRRFWQPQSDMSKSLPPLYDLAWRAVSLLLQRPWFHRAWIVQETAVPRDILVICGNDSISWDELLRAVQYAVGLGVFVAYGGSTTYQALRLFETRLDFQDGRLIPLHQVLLQNRSFLATDARDKVYGLLSLAIPKDIETLKARPNYHLSVEQLYQNITIALLEGPVLAAFSGTGARNQSPNRNLPSWVTDWSASDPPKPFESPLSFSYGDRSSFVPSIVANSNASNSTESTPVIDGHVLGLDGLLVDQVETVGTLSRTRYLRHVSHMFQLFVQCHDVLEQLRDWEQVAQTRLGNVYLTGEKRRDAYWYTLCAGRVDPKLTSAIKDPRYKYYIIIRSLRSFVRRTIRWFPRREEDTWYNRLFYSLFQAAWRLFGLTPAKIQRIGFPPESHLSNHRRLIRTKNGYIALAPGPTRPGDWIGVYKGGRMPLVVRKEGDFLLLIGESYVHGIMNGKAWDETRCKRMWFK